MEKEAIIIDVNGHMTDVTLVDESMAGVLPIYQRPEHTEVDPTPRPVLVGYQVAVKPPEGRYKLKFDIQAWEAGTYENLADLWGEGLTQAAIDAIRNAPKPVTELDIVGQQLVERELENLELKAQNDVLGQQLVEIDIRLLQGGM